jgi:hypothetical protein
MPPRAKCSACHERIDLLRSGNVKPHAKPGLTDLCITGRYDPRDRCHGSFRVPLKPARQKF